MQTRFRVLRADLKTIDEVVADQVNTNPAGDLTFYDIKLGSQGVPGPVLVKMIAYWCWVEVTNGGLYLGDVPQSAEMLTPDAHVHHEVDL